MKLLIVRDSGSEILATERHGRTRKILVQRECFFTSEGNDVGLVSCIFTTEIFLEKRILQCYTRIKLTTI